MPVFTLAQEQFLNDSRTYNGSTGVTVTENPNSGGGFGIQTSESGLIATGLSSAQYTSTYGNFGQNAIVGALGQRQIRSSQTFRSAVATISYDVTGGFDSYRGAQVGVFTNYVNDNNFIAACVQRADWPWQSEGGDLTLTIIKVRNNIATLLGYVYFAARNNPVEPTKWLSLSVLPGIQRTDSKWPITARVWSHDATDTTAGKTLTVYDSDVSDQGFFDQKGYVGTVFSLPETTGTYGYKITSISYYSQDDPIEIGAAYSLAADDMPIEPLAQRGIQGITLNCPYTLEQITNVVYEVSSSIDASDWSDWQELASIPVTTNTTGTYIHRTSTDAIFYRYRATYQYIYQGARTTSPPSDYVVAGRGVTTPENLDQLPRGVIIPIQKPGEGPDPTSDEGLKWADPTSSILIGEDYARLTGGIGTASQIARRGINIYNPATPLYRQASLELEANMATPLIRVRAGDYSRVILDSRGNTDFTGGGTGDVGTGRLFFFI